MDLKVITQSVTFLTSPWPSWWHILRGWVLLLSSWVIMRANDDRLSNYKTVNALNKEKKYQLILKQKPKSWASQNNHPVLSTLTLRSCSQFLKTTMSYILQKKQESELKKYVLPHVNRAFHELLQMCNRNILVHPLILSIKTKSECYHWISCSLIILL